MAEETSQAAEPQTTPDAGVTNTAANVPTGTQPQPEAQPEKTFTQADVDRIVQNRLKSAVKAELKKLTDDPQQPTPEDYQRQLSDKDAKIRSYESREVVENFLNDGRNKLNVRPENIRGIQALVIPTLEYDDQGSVTNLKEAIESAKSIAPALFANHQSNINANAGNQTAPVGTNMNDFIRRSAGFGN